MFSLVKRALLEEIVNPMITIDPVKTPWYCISLQRPQEHMHLTLMA